MSAENFYPACRAVRRKQRQLSESTDKKGMKKMYLIVFEFYRPVNIIEVMLSHSADLLTLFLGRFGYPSV